MLGQLILRDIRLRVRTPAGWLFPLVLFLMILAMFPLAITPEMKQLQPMAAGAVWIAAILAAMLGVEGYLQADLEDGTIEQIIAAGHGLAGWALSKLLVQWLTGGVMIALLALATIPFFGNTSEDAQVLILGLLIGTVAVTCWSTLAACLTVSLKGAQALLPLIALPLQIPVIIFCTGLPAIYHHDPHAIWPIIALLGALDILAVMLTPLFMANAMKHAISK